MTRISAEKNQMKIRDYLCNPRHPRSILISLVLACPGCEVNFLINEKMNKNEC